jgi:hypothetical protein
MSNPIFKAISELAELKIPFKVKEELLVDWLSGISKNNDSREACLLILQLLKEVINTTKFEAKIRFSFLNTIHGHLKKHIHNLSDSCWEASLPISAKEQDYAELVAQNYIALSEGFFIVTQELAKRTDEIFALYMSCYSLGQAQVHIAAIYKSPEPLFWQMVYKVFAWIEKYSLFETKINDNDLKDITLNDMFAQLFIFQSCDTSQFRPRDMLTIYNYLPKVCKGVSVYKLSDVKFQTEVLKIPYLQAVSNRFSHSSDELAKKINARQDLFVFDINQDLPPVIFNQTYLFTTNSLRYFTATSVVKNLEQIIAKNETWTGVLKSINNELFSRVIKSLEPGRKRKHTRSQTEHSMLGIIGFENIISFLYKAGRKNLLQNTQNLVNQSSSTQSFVNAEKKSQMGAIDGGFSEADFVVYQSDSDSPVWDKKVNTDITNRQISLKRLTIFDHSVRGYLLHWADDENSKAKIGDIFAIISDDKKRLEIAIIRRIAIVSQNNYKFGTEVLGFESEVVMMTHANNPTIGGWGIFIPAIKALKQKDSIIYPLANFQVGDVICLYKDNKSIKAMIAKELNASVAIVHAELDYGANTN